MRFHVDITTEGGRTLARVGPSSLEIPANGNIELLEDEGPRLGLRNETGGLVARYRVLVDPDGVPSAVP